MKKSLIFIAMLVLATTLFAENESVSCESALGQCTYTLSDESFSLECVCRDGSASGEDWTNGEEGSAEFTLPTEEECKAELDNICKGVGLRCENEAGECILEENGDYECWCFGFDRSRTGSKTFEEGVCDSTLVEECGTELATPRIVCTDEEILNTCVSYAKLFTNTCYEPMTDEELEAVLDLPSGEDEIARVITMCCYIDTLREEDYKGYAECLEAAESCENKECCDPCGLYAHSDGDDSAEDGGTDLEEEEDAANTEAPTDGASKEDTADGDSEAPTTDATPEDTADGENKKESKSDGCSMLFV